MKGLRRLAELYGRVERIEAITARMAADEAARATRELAAEGAWGREQQAHARTALAGGDREGWLLAESAGEFTALRIDKLARVQVECEASRDEAMGRYVASRLKTQQVVTAMARSQELEAEVEQRQAQAAADDRYAARLGWTRRQERMNGR